MASPLTSSARRLSRRSLLAALPATAALLAGTALPQILRAQEALAPAVAGEPVGAATRQFSFDLLSEEMKTLATKPHEAPVVPESFLDKLTYDDYRLIRFNPERARWAETERSFFQLHAFHMGWLFKEPVQIHEIVADQSRLMGFDTDDFIYEREVGARVPPHAVLPGVAGFRLHFPLNRPDTFDEIISFVGASYFRALGRKSAYGLSARGLAINTGMSVAEEFPRFSRFYVEKPLAGAQTITCYATLESASVTGAYRFIITPGDETAIDVTARLYFRADVEQLGIAPLTSMFLFAERNRGDFDDFRPNVHDSDGLQIIRRDGDKLWRPLANPHRLSSSYFAEEAPLSFGLHQRDRDFDHYQDLAAKYELRPSVSVEPREGWGKGAVRLVEIPSDLEINDNIVAFWVPEGQIKAGETREFSYRLLWGDLAPQKTDDLAYVFETRAGHGGVSGVENTDGSRKFVIDFKGGLLGNLPGDVKVEPVVNVAGGTVKTTVIEQIWGTDIWRLVLDIVPAEGDTVELNAHIAGYGRKLSETWLYQWIKK